MFYYLKKSTEVAAKYIYKNFLFITVVFKLNPNKENVILLFRSL